MNNPNMVLVLLQKAQQRKRKGELPYTGRLLGIRQFAYMLSTYNAFHFNPLDSVR